MRRIGRRNVFPTHPLDDSQWKLGSFSGMAHTQRPFDVGVTDIGGVPGPVAEDVGPSLPRTRSLGRTPGPTPYLNSTLWHLTAAEPFEFLDSGKSPIPVAT